MNGRPPTNATPATDPTPVADGGVEPGTDPDRVAAEDAGAETDGGGRPQPHTIRLELADEPGELLAALRPIAENGGNLLSIFHERGHLTPRGRIPVEVDVECPPDRFETIVDALRDAGVNVVEAGAQRYTEEVTLLLVGDLVGTDLSDTVTRIERSTAASVSDLSLSAPAGARADDDASARLRLGIQEGRVEEVVGIVRELASEKGLHVVEPLTEGSA
jgi:ACT domain-containing protein